MFWRDATKRVSCLSHTTIVSDVSLIFRIISEMFVSCDILTRSEITRKMTWCFIENQEGAAMCLSGILWILLWCFAPLCGSILYETLLRNNWQCLVNSLCISDIV